MKHLMTLVALLVSTVAVAQIPTLPWNPDENGDQFIGLPDLLGLLTVYGQEFENAIVAEDGESAIMYMGNMAYPLCELSCQELPGIWKMPSISELGLVWNEVFTPPTDVATWLAPSKGKIQENSAYLEFFYSPQSTNVSQHIMDETNNPARPYRCYCTAKQLPRVEYSVCADASNPNITSHRSAASIEACCQQKVSEGWLPLGGTAESDHTVSQAFWRFAQ